MEYQNLIRKEFEAARQLLDRFMNDEENIIKISKAAELMTRAIKKGGKVISCGNGGSHCDAMHFAEELCGNFRDNRKPLPGIAISDPSYISCTSNDYGFQFIFSRFIDALGRKDDVLLAISTSGNSKNIIMAAEKAKQKQMNVVALTGKNGGELALIADIEIRVAHHEYSDRIQEIHIKIIHNLIMLIEKMLM